FQSQPACQQPEPPPAARNRNFKLEKGYRVMILTKMYRVIVCALVFGALVAVAPNIFAQESNQPARTSAQKEEDVNLDTQLYLILATNRDVEDARMRSEERRVGKEWRSRWETELER